ncbi:hypothetical protein OMP38_23180 [Cohnella ginsengisoli]|uniref:Uncharacterized protein n=1 Tax=Cohnella ginsengisoli TaxID=425004 RepID=A0A9X4QPD8_9BACL|nr:hypothetical protein [Cohnella ginsengisoli]MDG0793416.1 hypothetical protein [Cohnella ginsengisoli]
METQFISTFRIKQLIQKRKFQGVASLKLMGSLNYVRIIKELSLLPYYKGIIADNPFPKRNKSIRQKRILRSLGLNSGRIVLARFYFICIS